MLPVKLYSIKELACLGMSNYPTLKRWQETQGFPIGRLLGKNTRVWTEEELLEWWNNRPTDPPENVKGPGAVPPAPEARKPKPPSVTHQDKRIGTGFQVSSEWEGCAMSSSNTQAQGLVCST